MVLLRPHYLVEVVGGWCRPWWGNCAVSSDAEMTAIDLLEDTLGELAPGLVRVRGLISSLELCHHKADRWIANIVEAISAGDSDRGLGTRPAGARHRAEERWQDTYDRLAAWCAGQPEAGSALLVPLGEQTPTKVWQVQRVMQKIRSLIDWPAHDDEYAWLVLGESGGRCPEVYSEQQDLWQATVQTTICDRVAGQNARLSLAAAIDMLWPCHWRFEDNLRIVLAAVGGDLTPREPFAACARNLCLLPNRPQLEALCMSLRAFGGTSGNATDDPVVASLGEPTPERLWLVASLEKTIRLQLDPPTDVTASMADLGLGPATPT